MNAEDCDWNWLRSFEAVARTGSLSAAARTLGSTQPTVGRHIDQLEEALGLALFVRSRQGLSATAEALGLLPHATQMAASLSALQRAASGEAAQASGTVRLSVAEIMALDLIPPLARSFRQRYPLVRVELVVSNALENLLRRDADVAVRFAEPTQDALVATKVGATTIGLYAHRDYLAEHRAPCTLNELEDHVLIGPDRDATAFANIRRGGLAWSRENLSVRTDNQAAQVALVRSGVGVGGVLKPVADRDPSLVPLLDDVVRIPLDVWIVMHEDLRSSLRVHALFQFLTTAFAELLAD